MDKSPKTMDTREDPHAVITVHPDREQKPRKRQNNTRKGRKMVLWVLETGSPHIYTSIQNSVKKFPGQKVRQLPKFPSL